MQQSQSSKPSLSDCTTGNITKNVIQVNSSCEDGRMRYVLERLVTHLHDFARETRLSTPEWMAGIQFLTQVGQTCTNVRQEFILLSDTLGLSLLVDSIDHPKPPGSTEGTVLGPFHTHEAPTIPLGDQISQDEAGEPMLVLCTVKNAEGQPISGVRIDIWETDSTGHYDVQHADRAGPDGRCVLYSDEDGSFWFKAIKPVPYPIPHDGPVGRLLHHLKRHPFRPSHMHFMFEKENYDHLISSLFLRDDPYANSDAVFGVKSSLVVDLGKVDDALASKYNIVTGAWLMAYDFVLVTESASSALRDYNSTVALNELNRKVKIVNGLPIPELD